MNLSSFRELTRFEQTLFGLPYVIAALFLALATKAEFQPLFLFIFLAFMAARISGMSFNQFIDRKIDRKNPRTSNRIIASGRLSVTSARLVAFAFLLLFFLCCLVLGKSCFILSLFAALLFFLYSYMKRLSFLCHLVLGMVHFLAPVMAFVAMTGTINGAILSLGFISLCTIVGSDVAYALQDYEFDCREGLNSIPVKFGPKGALGCVFLFQTLAVLASISLGIFSDFSPFYFLTSVLLGSLFFFFGRKLLHAWKSYGTSLQITFLFFLCNSIVSFLTMTFVVLSVIF